MSSVLRSVARQLRAVWMLLLVGVILSIASPVFLTSTNLLNVGLATSVVALLAIGQTYVIILAEIDLSVGATLGFTAVVTALVLRDHGLVPALASGLGVGAAVGLVNGLLVTRTRMPSFIATLAMLSILSGMTLQLTDGNPVAVSDYGFQGVGQDYVAGIPLPVWLMLAGYAVFGVLLARTGFGRFVYATGDNLEAARLSGIRIQRIKILAFVISGLLSALGGFILTARLSTAEPTAGTGLELESIAAVILGGTSLAGGRGKLLGTLIGALVLGVIDNGMNLLDVSPFLQSVVKGVVILLAVFLDRNVDALRAMVAWRKPPLPPEAAVRDTVPASDTVPATRHTPRRSPTMSVIRTARTAAVFAAATALALTGCSRGSQNADSGASSGKASGHRTATLIMSTLNNPFFVSVGNGAKSQASKSGVKLSVQNANNSDSTALNLATTAVSKQVGALIIDPVSSTSATASVKQANGAHIPVMAFDRKPEGGTLSSFIGYDPIQAGRNAADALATSLGKKGTIVEIQGILGTNVAQDRSKGFEEEIAKYPKIRTVAKQAADFDRAKALDVMTNTLQAHPGIDGVYAANDEMAMGALAALKARHLAGKVRLVGNDGIADALAAIQAGTMYGTNAESPYALGQKVISLAGTVLDGQKVTAEKTLQGKLVTKSNVKAYARSLIAMGDSADVPATLR